MSQSKPGAVSSTTLSIAAFAASCGLAGLVGSNSDRSMEQRLSEAFNNSRPAVSVNFGVTGDQIVETTGAQDQLHLTHLSIRPAPAGGPRQGERLMLIPEGGQQAEFEVTSVTEITGAISSPTLGTASPRLLMVTYREVLASGTDRAPKTVRLIVDVEGPVAGPAPASPARAL